MKSRIWRLAGVGVLCVSVSVQALADDPESRSPNGGQHGQGHQGNNHFRGLTILHEAKDGFAVPCFVSLSYMKDNYYA